MYTIGAYTQSSLSRYTHNHRHAHNTLTYTHNTNTNTHDAPWQTAPVLASSRCHRRDVYAQFHSKFTVEREFHISHFIFHIKYVSYQYAPIFASYFQLICQRDMTHLQDLSVRLLVSSYPISFLSNWRLGIHVSYFVFQIKYISDW